MRDTNGTFLIVVGLLLAPLTSLAEIRVEAIEDINEAPQTNFGLPSMNEDGDVVFWAKRKIGEDYVEGIFRGDAAGINEVFVQNDNWKNPGKLPFIYSSGDIYFLALDLSNGGPHLIKYPDLTEIHIPFNREYPEGFVAVTSSLEYVLGTPTTGPLYFADNPIDTSDRNFFAEIFDWQTETQNPGFTLLPNGDLFFAYLKDGSFDTHIRKVSNPRFVEDESFMQVDISEAGTFENVNSLGAADGLVYVNGYSNSAHAIYSASQGNLFVEVAESDFFSLGEGVAVGPGGKLVFNGEYADEENGVFFRGLFSGAGTPDGKIVSEEDRFNINEGDFQGEWRFHRINDQFGAYSVNSDGRVVFQAEIESVDGSREAWGIFSTTGVESTIMPDDPEAIEGHHWTNANGGVFGVASNWSDYDENEIADDIPTNTDTAVFALPSTYTVTLGQDQSVGDLIVSGDDTYLTINPDSHSLTMTDDLFIGYQDQDDATLELSGPSFEVFDRVILGEDGKGHLKIANPFGLEVDVLQLKSAGSSVEIARPEGDGDDSEHFLTIRNHLIQEAGTLVVEDSGRRGLSLLSHLGFHSSMTAGDVYWSIHSGATGIIRNGGVADHIKLALTVGDSTSNQEAFEAPPASLIIAGGRTTGNTGLPFQASFLLGLEGSVTVGSSVPGNVHVSNGGSFGYYFFSGEPFALGSWDIHIGSPAPGELLVEGVHPDAPADDDVNRSSVLADSFVINGYAADPSIFLPEHSSSVTVRDGGIATGVRFILYSERSGLFVDGGSGSVPSEIRIEEELGIRGGVVEASNGAEITFNRMMNITSDRSGRMIVNGGASVSGPLEPAAGEISNIVFTADEPGSTQMLTVSGVDSTGTSSFFEYNGNGPGLFLTSTHPDATALAAVSGGARLHTESFLKIGSPGKGHLLVYGVDPEFSKRAKVSTDIIVLGGLEEEIGRLDIEDGGLVEARLAYVSEGSLLNVGPSVTTTDAELVCSDSLIIGNDPELQEEPRTDGAVVSLTGGHIYAINEVLVQEYGRVEGTGFITAGDVTNHGYMAPGLSPGTLEIDGNFTQGPSGVLEMEVFGEDPAEQDQLIVRGDVQLDGAVQIVFVNHAPLQGESIPLLEVSGDYSESDELDIEILGLKPGFEASLEINDGMASLTAMSDGALLSAEDPAQMLRPRLTANESVTLTFFGLAGVVYRIDASSDLEEWVEATQLVGENNILRHVAAIDGSDPHQFYRVTAIAVQ